MLDRKVLGEGFILNADTRETLTSENNLYTRLGLKNYSRAKKVREAYLEHMRVLKESAEKFDPKAIEEFSKLQQHYSNLLSDKEGYDVWIAFSDPEIELLPKDISPSKVFATVARVGRFNKGYKLYQQPSENKAGFMKFMRGMSKRKRGTLKCTPQGSLVLVINDSE